MAPESDFDENARIRLRKEKDELGLYARTHMQAFVQWFTGYGAVNGVGLGWFATKGMPNGWIAVTAIVLFAIVSAQSIVACIVVIRHFRELARREAGIVSTLSELGTSATIPIGIYEAILWSLTLTATGIFVAWVVIGAFAPTAR